MSNTSTEIDEQKSAIREWIALFDFSYFVGVFESLMETKDNTIAVPLAIIINVVRELDSSAIKRAYSKNKKITKPINLIMFSMISSLS